MTKLKYILLVGAACGLSACSSLGVSETNGEFDHMSRIDHALQRAASSASATGNSDQSLAYLEKIYTRNNEDPQAAMDYAKALRESAYLKQADMVLAPFANASDSSATVKSEYAALKLASGDYKAAEQYAQAAIVQDDELGEAYHHLGIALDAQEMHEEAEIAFRKALDHWEGDPTPIMNNLALNLASQGFFPEAQDILTKAKSLAPYKIEIERNLRIVRALQQTEGGYVPKPKARPERSDSES